MIPLPINYMDNLSIRVILDPSMSGGNRSKEMMPDTSPSPRRGRGRRPAAEVRATVLAATADLLLEGGMPAVTFDRVAARAGSSKMTLYKWWNSPGALAFDAYFESLEKALRFPDTGDVAADLSAQLHVFVDVLNDGRHGQAIAGLVGAAQSDPELADSLKLHYTTPRRRLAVETIERGKRRGQITDRTDPETVVDQLWGACYHRLLLPGQPVTHEFADSLLRNLFGGIAGPSAHGQDR